MGGGAEHAIVALGAFVLQKEFASYLCHLHGWRFPLVGLVLSLDALVLTLAVFVLTITALVFAIAFPSGFPFVDIIRFSGGLDRSDSTRPSSLHQKIHALLSHLGLRPHEIHNRHGAGHKW